MYIPTGVITLLGGVSFRRVRARRTGVIGTRFVMDSPARFSGKTSERIAELALEVLCCSDVDLYWKRKSFKTDLRAAEEIIARRGEMTLACLVVARKAAMLGVALLWLGAGTAFGSQTDTASDDVSTQRNVPNPPQFGQDLYTWHLHDGVPLVFALLVGGVFLSRMARGLHQGQLQLGKGPGSDPVLDAQKRVAEESQVEEFFKAFRLCNFSATAEDAATPPLAEKERETDESARPETTPLAKLSDWRPYEVKALRSILNDASRLDNATARQRMLMDLSQRLRSVKERACPPGLRTTWQLVSALEEFFKQLAGKESNVTSSGLQTAADALEVLHNLCIDSWAIEQTAEPPARFLVVDDDAVGRHAVSFALKKAFAEPDLASNGQIGLAMATQQAYDIIFLDVEMPGMDGFEVCSRIHQTATNCLTPVVFVTRHSDFDSRAKGVSSGGRYLIGKPFLALEVTLKALALFLATRRERSRTKFDSTTGLADPAPLQAEVNDAKNTDTFTAASFEPTRQDFGSAFGTHAPNHIKSLRSQLEAISQTQDADARQELLGELYIGVHLLAEEAQRAELGSSHRLASALQGLLQRILERPDVCTPSTYSSAAAALELLADLCNAGVQPLLADPPVRILVVDDEPIARRALVAATQTCFPKPDSAGCGEEALALAAQNAFDLIFLDVRMPGMDGFATCSKVHETKANQRTPVVFVTSHSDKESREQAATSGGCGFISKPVLGKEILLIALAFILRGRLTKADREASRLFPA